MTVDLAAEAMLALILCKQQLSQLTAHSIHAFRIIGMNSITIYMVQRIVDFGRIERFFLGGVANLCPEDWAAVVHAAGFVAVGWLLLYFLYRQKIFLKI